MRSWRRWRPYERGAVRIDSLDLIRFGHFCGHKIELPATQPDYYLIYGDNEAGKSTLLRGISALLFGVPAKTPDVHSCKGSELRIGATISQTASPRGKPARITVRKPAIPPLFGDNVGSDAGGNDGVGTGADGQRLSFRRRKGTSGTLLDLNDGQIDDDALAPFLRELDRERFEQFFGLNHQRLHEGGEELLRGQGDVGSALFQAAGLLDLRRLLEKLDADAKEVFSPKSRTRTISRIIDEFRQAKSEIRRLSISAATVKEKQDELEAAKDSLAKLKAESHSLQQALERLRRIKSNKPDLARLNDLRTALAALEPVPILPADARRRRDEAAATLTSTNAQISTLTQDVEQRVRRIEELPGDSLFKAHEKEIEELNAGTSAYAQSVGDRTKRIRERDDAIELARTAWNQIWSRPVSEAESLKNAYARKEEILSLVAEHTGLTAHLATAEEELRIVSEEQQRLAEQLAQHPDLPDAAGLVAAVEHAKSLGDTDTLAAKLKAGIQKLEQNAQREMRKLAQWTGSIEELEALKTPLHATVDRYAREFEGLAETRRNLSMRLANEIDIIAKKENELGSLTPQISGASETDLAGVRARRDELWQLIRASTWEGTISQDEAARRSGTSGSLAGAFAEHLRKADDLADVRFANATEVAVHDRLVKEIAEVRAAQQTIETEVAKLEAAEREVRDRWRREWIGFGPELLSPLEMKEWMQARQAILDQTEQSREKDAEFQSLQERGAQAYGQIMARWKELGECVATGNESLPVLLQMAGAFAKQRERERSARDDIHKQLKSLSVEKRREKLNECKERLSRWSEKWSPHVAALLLPETSAPDQVARALAVLEQVFHQLDEANGLQYRVKRIGDNIEAFDSRVAKVVAALDPSCAAISPDTAVKQLHSCLLELRDAETERRALQEQNDRDKAMLAACRRNAQEASTALAHLKILAGCKDEHQLDGAITASEEKAAKKLEYKRIAAGLIERNAIADLAQIEEEASAHDLDSLQSSITAKEGRLKSSVDDISLAASRHGELTSEYERLETSEESALQAQRAEQALAQLRPAIAQYLRLRLASEVLQQAVESYREKHQGPILKRASELFARLTIGHHSGLTSDFGDDDKPVLVAIRQNGERVHVDGLSDGTRDQLYLALRLAAIEHHVETVTPCPVIFDDLLINSDDTRASAALDVIGELAQHTQVLFFTHHRRLAELGAKGGAQMIELRSLVASAVA